MPDVETCRAAGMTSPENPADVDDPPVRRALRVFALDPSLPTSQGGRTTIDIAYENLTKPVDEVDRAYPGCQLVIDGSRFRIFAPRSELDATRYTSALNLDECTNVLRAGLMPQAGNTPFACQMVYAVAMQVHEQFEVALGRTPRIPFKGMLENRGVQATGPDDCDPSEPMAIVVDATHEADVAGSATMRGGLANAYYDHARAEVRFGTFFARDRLSGSEFRIQTALSSDIVAHEVAHALLDAEKPLLLPTHPEVVAFHEGFADLIALFLHFTNRSYLVEAIERAGGDLSDGLITSLALEFGLSLDNRARGLRSVLATPRRPDESPAQDQLFNILYEPHALGAILAAAVFDAFRLVYLRKSGLLRKLAVDEMSRAKAELLADRVRKLAQDFLRMLIRAIDYLPPAHVTFSDYLRAILTADLELVPVDSWGYREALVDAFRRFAIPLHGVEHYAVESLRWKRWAANGSGNLCDSRGGDPRCFVNRRSLANVVRSLLGDNEIARAYGLSPDAETTILTTAFSREIGPDRTLCERYFVQLAQSRQHQGMVLDGGATLVFDVQGTLRYVIAVPLTVLADPRSTDHRWAYNLCGVAAPVTTQGARPFAYRMRGFLDGAGIAYAQAFLSGTGFSRRCAQAKDQMFRLHHHHFDVARTPP